MAMGYRHGDHICALYEDPAEQEAGAVEYLADGLRRGERCFYAALSQDALDRFRAALDALDIDTGGLLARGALILKTNADAHLAGGRFDTEAMLHMLNREVEASLAAGFAGFRTCGDMSWLLDHPDGWQDVVEYEALLNDLFHGVPACGMCQYDRRRLPAPLINQALATHSSVVVNRTHQINQLFEPARAGDIRKRRSDGRRQGERR